MKKLLVILFLIIAFPVGAEDLYLNSACSSGCDGTTVEKGWATAAAVQWAATDTVGKVDAGDTLHIYGTIADTLTIGASGTDMTSGAITIKWEDGAKLSKDAWGITSSSAIYSAGKSYLIFDGGTNGIIENTANGTGLTYSQQSYLISLSQCSNLEIKNLKFQNAYIRTQGTEAYAYGWSIQMSEFNNVRIHDNVFTDAYMHIVGIYRTSGTDRNLYVYNNSFDNQGRGGVVVGDGTSNSTMENINIFNNTFHKNIKWSGAPEIHTNLIHIHSSQNGTTLSGIKIYNNSFSGICGTNSTSFLYIEGNNDTASISSAEVYNNTFSSENDDLMLSCGNGAVFERTSVRGTQYYSNTFNINRPMNAIQAGAIGAVIKNNIFNVTAANAGSIVAPYSTSAVSSSDNNVFLPNSIFCNGSWAQLNLNSWKAAHSGFEANSQVGDPNLDSNLKPRSPSNAIDKGATLGSPYDKDMLGHTRPYGDAYDIGAYEYGSTGADTTAPTLTAKTVVTTPSTNQAPQYTFTSNEAGTITFGGTCGNGTPTTAIVGDTTVQWNLGVGTYSNCTITVTDSAQNASDPLAVAEFAIIPTSGQPPNVSGGCTITSLP